MWYFSLSIDHVLRDVRVFHYGHILRVRHDFHVFHDGYDVLHDGCVHFRGHAYDHGHGGHHAAVRDHYRIQDLHDCDHGYDLLLFPRDDDHAHDHAHDHVHDHAHHGRDHDDDDHAPK